MQGNGKVMAQPRETRDDFPSGTNSQRQPACLDNSNLRVGTILQFADASIQACDEIAEQLLGYTAEQLIGKTSFDQPWQAIRPDGTPVAPEDHPAIVALRTQRPCQNVTMGFYRPSGELVWLRLDAVPLFQPHTAGTYAVVITLREEISPPYSSETNVAQQDCIAQQDCSETQSELERLIDQLQESDTCFQEIFNTSFQFMGLLNLNGRVLEVNQAALEALGAQESEILGQWFWETAWWRHSQSSQDQLRGAIAAAASGEFIRYEVTLPNREGSATTIDFSLKPIFNERGQAVMLIAEGRDISDRLRNEAERQQAERALQEQTKLLQLIVDSVGDGLILSNSQGEFMLFNQAAERLFGRLTNEQSCDEWSRTYGLFLPDQQTLFPSQELPLYRAMRGEYATDIEVFVRRDPASSGRWVSISGFPVVDMNREVTGGVITCRDITDRKRNEQRLRESEERLQLGVQVAGVALARFDYASNTVALSPEAAALYGIPSDQLIISRDRIHATFHPDEQARLEQLIEQVLDPTGTGWFAYDHRVVWQNGEVRWLSVRKQVFFNRSGKVPRPDYAILAAIDITERKHSEATVQGQLAQIEAIYATAPIGLCFLDREYRFVQLNERLAEINGLSVAEHLGRTVRDILPDLAEVQEPIFEQVLQTGAPVLDVEVQGTTPAHPGAHRYWLVSYYPLIAAEGQILGINIMVQEITDRKRAEIERSRLLAEAQAARAEAEAANRSKDEFVAVVAHELRSPLNSISGWAKLLQTRKFDEATTTKALETISRNTQAQVQLVEDLLDISRMIKGTLQLDLASVDLGDVIEAALDIVRPMAEAKHIQIKLQLSLTPQISGDFNRLQQIAVNLLTNAIKFTPDGGRVEVDLEPVESQVQFRVRDTGKGIAAEFLPMIFERFQQGQKTTGSKDGLGLGLAIVKHLVELHAGTIVAESDGEGQGTTFTVRLPRETIAPNGSDGSPVTSDSKSSKSLAGIRILAVDDEPDMLDLMTFVLQESGAEVQSVTTAAAALSCLTQFKPDIVVSDVAMPEKNGYELIQQLRLHPDGQIPAIALTAYASATDEERSLQAGFQQHLTKPIEPEVLVAAIISLVRE
jgi:PAS domain S-box-containing protein